MYTIVFSKRFVALSRKLSQKLKLKLKENFDLLSRNPFHPSLHTKPLTGKLAGFYSFRLGRDYRVIFHFIDNDTIMLIRVMPRGKVYK